MSYLGLDLGGSSAKAAAFALDGSLLAAAKVPYVLESPRPGWREFNPATQWQALADAIRAVTAAPEVRHDRIRGIGISVAGEAVVPIAIDRTPLYNAFASSTRGVASTCHCYGTVSGNLPSSKQQDSRSTGCTR